MDYTVQTEIGRRSFSQGRGHSLIRPVEDLTLPQILDYIGEHPYDGFMRYHLREVVDSMGEDGVRAVTERFEETPSAVLFGVLAKTKADKYPFALQALEKADPQQLLRYFEEHPDIEIREMMGGPEQDLMNRYWGKIFHDSRENHTPFSEMKNLTLAIPADYLDPNGDREYVHVSSLMPKSGDESVRTGTSLRDMNVDETLERVEPIIDGIVGDVPILGVGYNKSYMTLVHWDCNLEVSNGKVRYRIKSKQGSSGKGTTKESAAASGIMETLERYSSMMGSPPNWPNVYRSRMQLVRGKHSDLSKDGVAVLDPNSMNLKCPYSDQDLYWVTGEIYDGNGFREALLPAQSVFLLSNLDESEVSIGSSNGLASGNTMEEAKLHSLFEVIERDGDYSMFYSPDRCFTIESGDGPMGDILKAYRDKGVEVQFLDLTTEFGVPTYRAFMKLDNGQILSGSGTHLDGRIAALRAVCELSPKCWVYKQNTRSEPNPAPSDFKPDVMEFDKLPNYSSGNVNADLQVTEGLMSQNGYPVFYADLTRSDIEIPVVRTIIPGLDIPSGVSRRQFKHFLQQTGLKLKL